MKDKVIETAGKAWQYLGQNGETEVNALAKRLKVKDEFVYQALGWLAREDKIDYARKERKVFVNLIDRERDIFKNTFSSIEEQLSEKVKSRKRGRSLESRFEQSQ